MSIEIVTEKGRASIDGDGINPYQRVDYRRAWHKGRAAELWKRYTAEIDTTRKAALEKRFKAELSKAHK